MVVAILIFCVVWFRPPVQEFRDITVPHLAGLKALQHKTVYDVEGEFKYKYAPSVAVLFGLSLSQFPFDRAAIGYYYISFFLWIILILLLCKEILKFRKKSITPNLFLAFILFWITCGTAFADELHLGNCNVFPIFLLFLCFKALDKPRFAIASGAALSAAIQFKLYCGLALPYLFFRRQWNVLLYCLATFLITDILLLAAFHGSSFAIAENKRWLISLFFASVDQFPVTNNISLLGVLGRLVHGPIPYLIWLAAIATFLFYQRKILRNNPILSFAFILSGIVILNPISWPNWVMFAFPALLLAFIASTHKSRLMLFVTILLLNLHRAHIGQNGGVLLGMLLLTYLFLKSLTKSERS